MAFFTEYMENLMQRVVANHPAEPEFHQAVERGFIMYGTCSTKKS